MPVDHGPCLLGTFEGVAGLRALLRVQADGGALGVRLMGVQTMEWMCRGLPWPLQWGPGAGEGRGTKERGREEVGIENDGVPILPLPTPVPRAHNHPTIIR